MTEYLRIKEVAKELKLSESTVREHRYHWGFFKMPNSRIWLIKRSDLDLLKKRSNNGPLVNSVGRAKEEKLCRSTNEKIVLSGGLISLHQTDRELDALLKPPSKNKLKNITTG